jgi:uncharacterized protein YbjQ (UPF0145 family)|nr:heavy metal-binding domain-containing protein [Kofleriaceae bacterium]
MPTNHDIDYEASLAQLEAGGLPIRAVNRLREETKDNLFTSDLTVNELLLATESGMTIISQVMGSCIYHIGRIRDYKGATGEIATISDGHRDSRGRALARMRMEAEMVGADAVVGVRLKERWITAGSHGKGGDDGGELIEFTVVGTAVKAPWITKVAGHPVLTDLSGQDLWALQREGFEPCGFLFEFCRYHVWHVLKYRYVSQGEITSARDAMDEARGIVANKLIAQARAEGAEMVVGSDVTLSMKEVPCGWEGCELNDLDVDVSWFATGVRKIPGFKQAAQTNVPPLILSMMPLGRRGGVVVEEEEESDAVKEAAQRAEERSAE